MRSNSGNALTGWVAGSISLLAVALCSTGCPDPADAPERWRFEPDSGSSLDASVVPVPAPSCEESRPSNCSGLDDQIWPVEADTPLCTDTNGNRHETTGEGAASWFRYGGCGSIKEYDVEPCSWVRIAARGDSCDSCVLWHVDYVVEQRVDGSWENIAEFDPRDRRGITHEACVQIESERFRIRARDGFYVRLYTR